MQALATRFITEEEYWALEAQSPIKHEYFDGCIYAMAGGSNRHAVLCTKAAIAVGSRLRGKPCRVVGSEQRVKIEATGLQTYPDVSIYCPPARFEGNTNEVLLNPSVIIEVLSPSTELYDRGAKFEHYKQISSLTDYLLVAQDHVQVDHYRRQENGDWLLHTARTLDESITLEVVSAAVPLGELYDGIEFPAEPRPLRSPIEGA
jgi:Uma2 family endonuclease